MPVDQIELEAIEKRIREEVETGLKAEYIKKLEESQKRLEEENRNAMKQVVEEWRSSQKPPDESEIEKLLNQEYFEFKIKLPNPDKADEQREFVIRELPQSVEKKFFKRVKDQLLPKLSELSSVSVRLSDKTVEERIKAIIEMFEPSFDVMAETVAIILNPFGATPKVTVEWVQENVATFRQWNIILAQERANRIRDFFSHVSQGSMRGISGRANSR
jgi:hypothetical protein